MRVAQTQVPAPQPTPTPAPYPAPTATPSASSEGIFSRFVAFLNDLFEAQPVYAAASQAPAAVAAPIGEVYFLLSDHLGSTTVTLNLDGSVRSEIRYDACPLRGCSAALREGETRYTSGTTPTDRQYTGQINESELGLYFYNARWYDPTLGRFTQPDSIVPQAGSPLGWDRYAYTLNNPVNWVDPSGHKACDGEKDNDCYPSSETMERIPTFSNLPIDPNEIAWIQWYGGTKTAYQDHLNYLKDPSTSYNYDGYCQGFHCGIDLGADWGDPVYAGIYGSVLTAGKSNGGYYIIIQVGDYQVLYQGLDGKFRVEPGYATSPNTIISGVGNHSANSSAGNNHLHLEIRYSASGKDEWKNRIANPLKFMYRALFDELQKSVPYSPINNVTFQVPDQNPLTQKSPIFRGGPVLWDK